VKTVLCFIIFLLLFYVNPQAIAATNIGFNLGYTRMQSESLKNYNIFGEGHVTELKLGSREVMNEFGIYLAKRYTTAKIDHDEVEGQIKYNSEVLGVYFAKYFNNTYVEIGYGKVSGESKINGEYSPSQKKIIEKLYKSTDIEKNSTEIKLTLGLKLMSFDSSVLILNGTKIYNQDNTIDYSIGSLELKMTF